MEKTRCTDDNILPKLVAALERLMARTHDTACVLIEDVGTEKFIQFGRGPDLILDLPTGGLTADEHKRAASAFIQLGVDGTRDLEAPDVNGEPITRAFSTYEYNFSDDSERAAQTAISVFRTTYRLPNATYMLYEN